MRLVAAIVAATLLVVTSGDGHVAAADPPREIDWFVPGDSYTAGHGTNGDENDQACRRSGDAWAYQARNVLGAAYPLEDASPVLVACTGNTTVDFDTQWDGRRHDLVTFSFGGNDIDFDGVLKLCAIGDFGQAISPLFWLHNSVSSCPDDASVRAAIDRFSADYRRFLEHVARDAVTPGGNVVVVGYPSIFADPFRWSGIADLTNVCNGVTDRDVQRIRGWAGHLNATIGQAIADYSASKINDVTISFVNVNDRVPSIAGAQELAQYLFEPGDQDDVHTLCGNGAPWMNGADEPGAYLPDVYLPQFHPNEAGHEAEGHLVAAVVGALDWTNLAPVREQIQDIDFSNTMLPAGSCTLGSWPGDQPIQLNGGSGSAGTVGADDFIAASVGAPSFADLDGDGDTDALLLVQCNAGGVTSNSFSNAVLPLTLSAGTLELLSGHNLGPASTDDSTIDTAALEGSDIVVQERYRAPGDVLTQGFFTGVATVRWRWSGTEFVPEVTKVEEPTTGTAACSAEAIGSDTPVVFYSGPFCAGDWAIGTIEDLTDTDMDFVFQEVFHFENDVWTDVGQFFIDANCAQGLLTSGMPRDIALQLAPDDLCIVGPIAAGQPEPVTGPLERGDLGERVTRLQSALQQQVDPGLVVDGQFGAATEEAVRRVQAENGLAQDGIAGPATFAALGLPYP